MGWIAGVLIAMGLVCLYPVLVGHMPWWSQAGAAAFQCIMTGTIILVARKRGWL